MRIRRSFSILMLGAVVPLSGCLRTTRMVQRTQAPEVYKTATVEALEQTISARYAAIKTLTASVLLTASTGGGKEGQVTTYTSFRGYIFVRKPNDLRVLLELPVLGSRALDMVSNGQTFTLMHATAGHGDVWIQGSNTITTPSKNGLENLRPPVFFDSLLVPGVRPDELVALTESTRVIQPTTKHQPAIEEPDYELYVLKKGDGDTTHVERVVHFSRVTMLPFEQDIYDAEGRPVTIATYEHYEAVNGLMFPMLINIRRPLDDYALKLQVTKLTVNQDLADDQFELKIPAGVKVQQMN